MLNTVSAFAAQGGLGEAASWIVLRQDIYVSLTQWQPLRISLESYKGSSAFRDTNDESWTNRAIFLCGQVLDYATRADTHLNAHVWTSLNEDLLHWYESVPWRGIGPYFPDSPPVEDGGDPVFPNLWMTQPTHGKSAWHALVSFEIQITDRTSSPWISTFLPGTVAVDGFCSEYMDSGISSSQK